MKRHRIGAIVLALSELNLPRRCRSLLLKYIWQHRSQHSTGRRSEIDREMRSQSFSAASAGRGDR